MADDTTDRLGDGVDLGPGGGTAEGAQEPQAQGVGAQEAGGAPPQEPAGEPGGTGEPEPLDLSQPQATGTDARESFQQFTQQAYQEQVERGRRWKEQHPELADMFDDKGRLIEPTQAPAPQPTGQQAGIDLTGGQQAPQQQPGVGGWQNPIDILNAGFDQAAANSNWAGLFVEMERARQNPRVTQLLGIQPMVGGQPPLTPEQVAEISRQQYEQLDQGSTALLRGMRSLRSECGDEFMEQMVPGPTGVKMPLEDAVIELCRQNGVLDPRQMMVSDPRLQAHYIAQLVRRGQERAAQPGAPGGTQLPSTGASMPPGHAVGNADAEIEDAGFTTTAPQVSAE